MAQPPRPARSTRLLLAAALASALAAGSASAQPMERARAAEARGDLRAAQIELRNAVRAEPQNGAARLALARVSLDLNDPETAEREARAALDSGFDPPAATGLLLRSHLIRGRFQELLRDFPMPGAGAPPAVAGQVAAGRALAELNTNNPDRGRAAVADALRLAPNAPESHLVAATLAMVDGDRAAAQAAVDRALAAGPDNADALIRKASFLAEDGNFGGAVETLGRLVARSPGHLHGRVLRAELLIRSGKEAEARQDVDFALRISPGSVPANYLVAMLQVRAQDWRAADDTLQRLSPVLPNLADGLLLLATVKRALNQAGQAEDAAQRYVARRPEDGRGVKLLASMQLDTRRFAAAAETLSRYTQRVANDAEALDMLGRALVGAGRPRDAVAALEQAAALAPDDSAVRARLAAARLAAGDAAGTARAAEESLRMSPGQAGAREMLAVSALARGDLAAAQAELDRLDANQRRSEAAGTIQGLVMLGRFDIAGARSAFEGVLRDHPDVIGARLGLARVATAQGNPGEAERLLGEVLQRAPTNPEAIGRLIATAGTRGPRAQPARLVLEGAQASHPEEPALALALASVLGAAGDSQRALDVLSSEPLRRPGLGAALPLARSMAHATLQQWPEAEQAARAALVEEPTSPAARRQLIALLLRAENPRGAEALAQEGVRLAPGNAGLQQILVGVVQQTQGIDAALEVTDRLAETEAARPASLSLRGDLLLAARRPADAAQAFARAQARFPSSALVQRQAAALQAAGQPAQAAAALAAWLQREPEDMAVLNTAAQFDILAGRNAEAERKLAAVVERMPQNAVALNNLAWLMAERGDAQELARALPMAERAYLMAPSSDTADTLGWILARSGQTERAVTLLRLAVHAPRPQGQEIDPAKVFRLAHTLRTAGQREEAVRLLEPVLAGTAAFPQRAEAERLMAELRGGR